MFRTREVLINSTIFDQMLGRLSGDRHFSTLQRLYEPG